MSRTSALVILNGFHLEAVMLVVECYQVEKAVERYHQGAQDE